MCWSSTAKLPTILLSTASPYKFASDVVSSLLGADAVKNMDFFACSEKLEQLSGVAIPRQVRQLRSMPVRHTALCEADGMEAALLKELKK